MAPGGFVYTGVGFTLTKKYILCVNIEHFGFVPSEIKQYIVIDQDELIIPFAINIYDLDILTAECSDGDEFLRYLEFRGNNIDILTSIDELEVFAYFKRYGMNRIQSTNNTINMTIPLNMINDFDRKYQLIATSYVLGKTINYPDC